MKVTSEIIAGTLEALLIKGLHGDFFIYELSDKQSFLQIRLEHSSDGKKNLVLGFPDVPWSHALFGPFAHYVKTQNVKSDDYVINGTPFLDVHFGNDYFKAGTFVSEMTQNFFHMPIETIKSDGAISSYTYFLNRRPIFSIGLAVVNALIIFSYLGYEMLHLSELASFSLMNWSKIELIFLVLVIIFRFGTRTFVEAQRHPSLKIRQQKKFKFFAGNKKQTIANIIVVCPVMLSFFTTH